MRKERAFAQFYGMQANLRYLLHILGWMGLWLLLPLLLGNGTDELDRFLRRTGPQVLGIGLLVGLNVGLLLPHLFFRRQRVAYFAAALLLLALITFLLYSEWLPWQEWLRDPDRPQPRRWRGSRLVDGFRWVARLLPLLLALIGSTLIEVVRYISIQEREAIALEKEKLETEVKFLKSQINPHFLFNALNNIYTLTLIKSDTASEHLLRLSGILRYMLYDGNTETVPLQKEIEYLRNYISLAMLKDSSGLNVTVELDESRPQLLIAPMLLVPFVENAFKHSQFEDTRRGWIDIRLQTQARGLRFSVRNSRPVHIYTKDQVGGIGLENVKRRLALTYPGRHRLEIRPAETDFSVTLELELV